MLKIVVVAKQNEEISKLCSELNKHGFQCSMATGENALEQVAENTPNLLLIEFTGAHDVEALCRYMCKRKRNYRLSDLCHRIN